MDFRGEAGWYKMGKLPGRKNLSRRPEKAQKRREVALYSVPTGPGAHGTQECRFRILLRGCSQAVSWASSGGTRPGPSDCNSAQALRKHFPENPSSSQSKPSLF